MSALPRLLYFNGPWDYLGERVRRSFVDPFAALLRQDFEVISVEGDRDFKAEVEHHRPDVVLFHTGCESPGEPNIRIRNTDAYREIPRLGWVYRDPFTPTRAMAMDRLRQWHVDQVITCFRPSDAPAKQFENTFYLPWWIDPSVYRDHGEPKLFPVTLTGAGWFNQLLYTWRSSVAARLLPRIPVFHAPSLGNAETGHGYAGEDYVRLLNRSRFSAACGSVNRYFVLKLLEIPAARCCLVAEEIDVLKAAGFVDGVNCVFATPENVVEKLEFLLERPEQLQAITDAGYELVHTRHTLKQRRIFAEWYKLWRTKAPDQRIVQTNPFAPLGLVPRDAPTPQLEYPKENPLIDRLVDAYRDVEAGRCAQALPKFEDILRLIPWVAEARLGVALCYMRLGKPSAAGTHLARNIGFLVNQFGYDHPDPVDIAMTSALCVKMGDRDSAVQLLSRFAQVRHPSVNAMRWMLARANSALAANPAFQVADGDDTTSVDTVHLLSATNFSEWRTLLASYAQ